MAVDTAPKRRSAAGVPFLPLGPGVTPDGASPLAWRQQAGWGYSGIPAGEDEQPVAPTPTHRPIRWAAPDHTLTWGSLGST